VVVDLDGTLWEGIVGEEGATLTEPCRSLQQVLIDLQKQGVILAICSKNNKDDVRDLLENGPIQPRHFATWRINWKDKPENIVDIAKELRIGLDSIVFIDDSAYERAWMRTRAPEVLVLEPDSQGRFDRVLANLPGLVPETVTEESQRRTEMYAQERSRQELARRMSIEEFIHEIALEVWVWKAEEKDLPRIGELVRRVNQFNLCANRRDDSGLKGLLPQTYVARVLDRFGDYGLVGVAIVIGDRLDTFLLSCRALGRGVEYEFLGRVIDLLGLTILHAWYIPTPRNSPCADFLPKFGFVEKGGVWTWTKS
jgi:FkbH-like protein